MSIFKEKLNKCNCNSCPCKNEGKHSHHKHHKHNQQRKYEDFDFLNDSENEDLIDKLLNDNDNNDSDICGVNIDDVELDVENEIDALSLVDNDAKNDEEDEFDNIVEKSSKVLEIIYDIIREMNYEGEDTIKLNLINEFPEIFENESDDNMSIILKLISNHLIKNNFNVTTQNKVKEYDGKVERTFNIIVSWLK